MKKYVNYITICIVLVAASGCSTSRKESAQTVVFDWNSADCARYPYEPFPVAGENAPKAPPKHINIEYIQPIKKKEYFKDGLKPIKEGPEEETGQPERKRHSIDGERAYALR